RPDGGRALGRGGQRALVSERAARRGRGRGAGRPVRPRDRGARGRLPHHRGADRLIPPAPPSSATLVSRGYLPAGGTKPHICRFSSPPRIHVANLGHDHVRSVPVWGTKIRDTSALRRRGGGSMLGRMPDNEANEAM